MVPEPSCKVVTSRLAGVANKIQVMRECDQEACGEVDAYGCPPREDIVPTIGLLPNEEVILFVGSQWVPVFEV